MPRIEINDVESIKKQKEIEKHERELINSVINRDSNSTDELLACLSTVNLIHISDEYHSESYSTIGYKLAANGAQTLGRLYEVLLSIRHGLIKESDKVQSTHRLDDMAEDLKQVTFLVDNIMNEISKLLTCNGFIHSIDISYDDETSEIFQKTLILKRHSSSIPNPHQIPAVYQVITGRDQKQIYRIYSNFTHYFTCNWIIGIKSLRKIKQDFNSLHNLCPLVRLSIIKKILQDNAIDDIPSDIITSLTAIDPQNLIYFHASYITSLIHNSKYGNATTDLLMAELQKIAQKLLDPMKDVLHFNIVMETTVKVLMIMRDLQGQNSLNLQQQQTLHTLEKFFAEISKKVSIPVREMLAASYKISGPMMSEIKKTQMIEIKQYDILQPPSIGM